MISLLRSVHLLTHLQPKIETIYEDLVEAGEHLGHDASPAHQQSGSGEPEPAPAAADQLPGGLSLSRVTTCLSASRGRQGRRPALRARAAERCRDCPSLQCRSPSQRKRATEAPALDLLGQGFKPRGDVDCWADDGEIQPPTRADIAVHDVADMDADAVAQRITSQTLMLLIQLRHRLLRLHGSPSADRAGRRLAQREDSKQSVAHEFQDFASMPARSDRTWHRNSR